MMGDEVVERLDAALLHPQAAAGTSGVVRLAAPLRAVGEDRLQRRTVETGHRQLGQAQVDRLLVARVHDGRDRQRGAGNDWLTILDGDTWHVRLAALAACQWDGHTGLVRRYPAISGRGRLMSAGSRQ